MHGTPEQGHKTAGQEKSPNAKLTVEEMGRISIADFKRAEKLPLAMVLDNVRSMHNIGSVLRTADAFRLREVWLCGITATPDTNPVEIHKTALGAEDSVEWHHTTDTLHAVERLRAGGYTIVAIEQCHGSTMLHNWEAWPEGAVAKPYAFIMGNEVRGVDQRVVDAADLVIEIPQFGTKHSMNVSVTAGIVMWEVLRQALSARP